MGSSSSANFNVALDSVHQEMKQLPFLVLLLGVRSCFKYLLWQYLNCLQSNSRAQD